MRNLFYRFTQFMQGRYGYDQLNQSILIVCFALSIINFFSRSWVLRIIELLLIILFLYRAFSKNIYKRSNENRKFSPVYNAVKNFFVITYKRIKEIKTHRYIKCAHCKAILRLPKRKGRHNVRCPKCGKTFEANFWY